MDDSGIDAPVANAPATEAVNPGGNRFRLDSTAWMALAIGAVVVIATAIVLFGGNRAPVSYPADSPEGALRSYLIAWYDDDYVTAYDYFSQRVKAQMQYYEFTQYGHVYSTDQTVTIDRTTGTGDRRTIFLTVNEYYGADPGSSYSRDVSVNMIIEAGAWRIDEALSGVDPNYGS